MTVKIKSNFDIRERLKKIQSGYLKEAPREISKAIISSMARGESPVSQGQWDRPYSPSYLASIRGDIMFRFINGQTVPLPGPDPVIFQFDKSSSPVNLKLSGQLYKALEVKADLNKIVVTFNDKMRARLGNEKKTLTNAELADIHNRRGAGKAKAIRRILPTVQGEEFNKSIQLKMDLILRKVVRDSI